MRLIAGNDWMPVNEIYVRCQEHGDTKVCPATIMARMPKWEPGEVEGVLLLVWDFYVPRDPTEREDFTRLPSASAPGFTRQAATISYRANRTPQGKFRGFVSGRNFPEQVAHEFCHGVWYEP